MSENIFRRELLEQARRLVFNKSADAAALAFSSEADTAQLRKMDLSALSSIRRMANGAVEIKFIDRIKLIELLLSAEGGTERKASDGFIEALDRAARRLGAERAQTDDCTDGGAEEV